MSGKLDELSLQRLVDGAMSENQRYEFLRSLDGDPQNWREVAMAFVEEQVWSQTLGDEESLADDSHPGPPKALVKRPRSKLNIALRLAASLLLTLTIGYQWGRQTPRIDSGNEISIAPDAHNAGLEVNAAPQRDFPSVTTVANEPQPTCRLQLTASGDDGVRTLELPVYERSPLEIDALQLQEWESIELLNRELVEHGYRIDRETGFLTGQMNDGRHLVVPIHRTSLCYAIQ